MVLFKMASSSDESPDGRRSVAIFENLCLGDKDVKKDNLLFFLRFLQDEKPLKVSPSSDRRGKLLSKK